MTGANYLPDALTPPLWDYNTGNYYLNITFLPFLELGYKMTLFKLKGSSTFNNQDRSLSARFRILKEKKYLPALVFGSNDMYSSKSAALFELPAETSGNRFFSSFYLTGTKNIALGEHNLSGTIGFIRGLSKNNPNAGFFGGLSYSPPVLPQLKLMAEYDSKVFNTGAGLLLFKHLYLFGMAHELKRFTGGFACFVYLNN